MGKKDYIKFVGKEVIITHKSGMADAGKLTLIKNSKKWKGVKGYIYCLGNVPYKMRSIKSIREIKTEPTKARKR